MDAVVLEPENRLKPESPPAKAPGQTMWLAREDDDEIAVENTITFWCRARYEPTPAEQAALMSVHALARIWDSPEEDEAWADL